MNKEYLDWLASLYEYYVLPGRRAGQQSLNCHSWSRLAFLKISVFIKEKTILSNEIHSALFLDGVYIDVEFNAFITGFDWKSTAITDQARIVPICSKYSPEIDQIYKFYSSPATEGFHLWHNKVI